MTTFSALPISGAANGLGVKVVATGTPGTTIHTAVSGTTSFDEIWLYAYNSDTVKRLLTIEWGGTTSPDNVMKVSVESQVGWVCVVPGLRLRNSLVIGAFADAANVVAITGYVNQIAP